MPATVNGPVLVKINKKTGENTYTLYYPQTNAQYVLYAPDVISDPDFTALTHYNQYGESSQNGAYLHVDDVLDVIFKALNNVSNVLEFKGVKALYSDLGTASAGTVGDVWVVNEAHDTYPAGTLYVGATDGAASPTYSWEPLGGNNTIYATKDEAIHTIVGDNTGLKFGYASEANATHSVEGVSTIGTTAVNTLSIANAIETTTAGSAIPNVQAVRDFAGSAGKLNTSAATAGSTYYFVAVDSATATNNQVPYNTGFAITLYTQVASGAASAWANLHVKQADTLTKGFSIGDQFYTGDKYMAVTTPTAGEGGLDFAYTETGSGASATIGVSVALPTVGTSGVYSAVEVDAYGRAVSGAQSIVFANSLQDPDLNQLVVGGLAFVSDGEIAKTGTIPTNGINLNN